jgi:hypothetical protein
MKANARNTLLERLQLLLNTGVSAITIEVWQYDLIRDHIVDNKFRGIPVHVTDKGPKPSTPTDQ